MGVGRYVWIRKGAWRKSMTAGAGGGMEGDGLEKTSTAKKTKPQDSAKQLELIDFYMQKPSFTIDDEEDPEQECATNAEYDQDSTFFGVALT